MDVLCKAKHVACQTAIWRSFQFAWDARGRCDGGGVGGGDLAGPGLGTRTSPSPAVTPADPPLPRRAGKAFWEAVSVRSAASCPGIAVALYRHNNGGEAQDKGGSCAVRASGPAVTSNGGKGATQYSIVTAACCHCGESGRQLACNSAVIKCAAD